MLGFGLYLYIGLYVAHIVTDLATDQGSRERRRFRSSGGWRAVDPWLDELQSAGVVLKDLETPQGADGRSGTRQLRRMVRRSQLAPLIPVILIVAMQLILGFAPWIAAALIAGYVALHSVSSVVVSTTETRAYENSWALFVLACLTKSALVFAGVVLAYEGILRLNQDAGHWTVAVACLVASFLLITYCYLPVTWLERRAMKHREARFATEASTEDTLFLRSFDDDTFELRTPMAGLGPRWSFVPGRRRFEEFAAAMLSRSTELVAIGRPGEKIPHLGASRTYWTDDTWQQAIRSTAAQTKALIVVAGRTQGLSWEVGQLKEMGLLPKTIVILPPDGAEGTRQRYQFLVDALEAPAAQQVPLELTGLITAVTFREDGTIEHLVAPGRDWSAYAGALLSFMATLEGATGLSRAEAQALQRIAQQEDLPGVGEIDADFAASAERTLNQHRVDSAHRAAGVVTLPLRHRSYLMRFLLKYGKAEQRGDLTGIIRLHQDVARWFSSHPDPQHGWVTVVQALELDAAEKLIDAGHYDDADELIEGVITTTEGPRVRVDPTEPAWDPVQIGHAGAELACRAAREQGDDDAEEAALHQLRDYTETHRLKSEAVQAANALAVFHQQRRQWEKVHVWSQTRWKEAAALGQTPDASTGARWSALALVELGRAQEAEAPVTESLRLARYSQHPDLLPPAVEAFTEVYLAAGKPAEALAELEALEREHSGEAAAQSAAAEQLTTALNRCLARVRDADPQPA
ncbi:hypothetical protein [Nesterenkonia alba]|uniref:hypothetical protein n=1 Tax=Nesterenkonia alba TaxID=515814 RepID=UPI0003B61DF5|nr:hypothetical protein [Nesterenkonia alba]